MTTTEHATDVERLRMLIATATDSDLVEDGRYFTETCQDLTRCTHGDGGRYGDEADGELVAFLWNRRRAVLASLSAVPTPKIDAIERIPAAIAARQLLGTYYELAGLPDTAREVRSIDWQRGTGDGERLMLATLATLIETVRKEEAALTTPDPEVKP